MQGIVPNINQNYFQSIDSPRKAYWLGMLYADGSNDKRGRIVLGLSGEDRCLLEWLKKDIGFEGKIYSPKQYSYHKTPPHRLEFQNRKMSNDLLGHGVIYNKSLTLEFPSLDKVSLIFLPHFIRGYFDGDGCVSKIKNGLEVSITSSPAFCASLKQFLVQALGISIFLKSYKKSSAQSLQMSGRSAIIFLEYIYRNSDIKMPRKYAKFQDFIKTYTPRTTLCGSSIPSKEYGELVSKLKSAA